MFGIYTSDVMPVDIHHEVENGAKAQIDVKILEMVKLRCVHSGDARGELPLAGIATYLSTAVCIAVPIATVHRYGVHRLP